MYAVGGRSCGVMRLVVGVLQDTIGCVSGLHHIVGCFMVCVWNAVEMECTNSMEFSEYRE